MWQSLHRDSPSNSKDNKSFKTYLLLQSTYSEHSDMTEHAVQCRHRGWHGFREKFHDWQCDNCGSILRCCFTLLCFPIIFTGFLCVCYFYSLKLVLYAFKNSCILNYDSSSKRASLGGSVIVYQQCRRHRRHGSIPESGRYPGGGHDNPLQYSCLENPLDRGAWQGNHRVAESDTTEATKHNKPKKVGSHCFKV